MNIVHIIGNGFDLNQGLPTSYAHFYEYLFQLKPKPSDTDAIIQFRDKLKERLLKDRTDKWSDLEKTLGEMSVDFESIDDFLNGYIDLYICLLDYLKAVKENSVTSKFESPSTSIYRDLAMPWRHLLPRDSTAIEGDLPFEDVNFSIINFNYTDTVEELSGLINQEDRVLVRILNRDMIYRGCQHVHHKLVNRDIILGVDNINQIANSSFRNDERIQNYMVKPRTNVELGNLEDRRCRKLINEARIVCIYGMSLGETDLTWWKEIGKRLKSDPNVCVLYFPYIEDIGNYLAIQYTMLRNQATQDLCTILGIAYQEVKNRIFVNFCNLPNHRNIFTNTKKENISVNFENTMAILQESDIIRKPRQKSTPSSLRFSLENITQYEDEFRPRLYKKRAPSIEQLIEKRNIMPEPGIEKKE